MTRQYFEHRIRHIRTFYDMARQSLIKEFFLFVKEEKKWWMIPLLAVLLLVGAIMVFAGSSPLAPFLYPLF